MTKATADRASVTFGARLGAFPTTMTTVAPRNPASATHRKRRSVPVLNARTNAKAKGAAAKRIESRWISRCRGDRFIAEVFSSA